jgi:dipeptidyl aminopeptidase/acylaminoacyl peptidase
MRLFIQRGETMPGRRSFWSVISAAAIAAGLGLSTAAATGSERRLVELDDLHREIAVSDPQVSPDGEWVAYTVRKVDAGEDKSNLDVWMSRWDGSRRIQLTFSKDAEGTPRWSPDGRHLAFLSGRDSEEGDDQIWLLSREGGEAERISDFKGGVSDYAWAPDGRRLAVIALDPDPDAPKSDEPQEKKKAPRPIVVDRYQFKMDGVGYLAKRRQHLYLFDLESRRAEILTPGEHDDVLPSWSPDGGRIAFVSKRGKDPDRHENWDVYTIEPRSGAGARRVSTFEGPDAEEDPPAWSPDGASIAYVQGGPEKLIYYAVKKLALAPSSGGAARLPLPDLDRNVSRPSWSADGSAVLFLYEDDRRVHLARIPAGGGKLERLLDGAHVISEFSIGGKDRIAVLRATAQGPAEVFALDGGALRPLSRQNEDWLGGLRLAAAEEISFKSRDGTTVNGFLLKPPDYEAGRRYPAILRIHGGPTAQYEHDFLFDWQLFAARGYLVVGANPRGSSGRGEKFASAIYADWGNKDAEDVLAAVDYAVAKGVADPGRLGVGGWSYGGMLTNYVIARDRRFKAAVSGAGESNIWAAYGTDHYIRVYEQELGPPWRNPEAWARVSFPFLKADRIGTPTLFLCGQNDFNVPLLHSEQMYQALKSLGVDTQLVIYPDESHTIRRPSFKRDRLERYLAWYDRHLGPKPAAPAQSAAR